MQLHVLYKNGKMCEDRRQEQNDSELVLVMITTITAATKETVAMAERITASEARKDFRGTLNRVVRNNERLVVTRHHDDEVAMIPIEDLRRFEMLERQIEDAIDAEAARRVLADPDEGRESWEDAKKDLGL